MAEVVDNKNISIMRFNTCDTVEIQIISKIGEGTFVTLCDNDVRLLYKYLKEWLEK